MSQRGHILDDAWFLDYATGAMDEEAYRVLLGSHVELSGEARERLAALEELGGQLLDAGPETDIGLGFDADDVIARSRRLEGREGEPGYVPRRKIAGDVPMPAALQTFLDREGITPRWSFLGPGLRKAVLWRGETGERLWLLRARPGVTIPHHGHSGSELTLVLKGSFWDGEQQYMPGDVEEAHGEVEHDIRIDDAGECVCLALTEGRLRFGNPLLRAFQVFTGL